MLTFVHQRPEDLALSILTTDIQPVFRILKQDVVRIRDWRFMFAIVGESHWVKVEQGRSLVLQEILACVRVEAQHCLHQYACCEHQSHEYTWGRYSVGLHFDAPLNPSLVPDRTLTVRFPSGGGEVPVTEIHWKQEEGRINWWTTHTYPDQKKITFVHTYSTFDCCED